VAITSGCNREGAASTAASRPPPAVKTVAAIARDVPVYIDAIGKTVSPDVVNIIPQVAGKVVQANVTDGAYVKQGDLLFQIEREPFDIALAQAQATLGQNQAEQDLAVAEFKRAEELFPQNAISQLEYDQKKSDLGVAQAKVDAAKADIRQANWNLQYTEIRSPITGRAGARLIVAGNVVKANEGVMLTIQRLDPIYAEFTITENELGTVRKFMQSHGMQVGNETDLGLKAEVEVPGNSTRVLAALGSTAAATQPATGPAEGRLAHVGTLTFLDNTVQSSTGTVKLRATVPNGDRYLWPGQFVNVRLVLTTRKDAVLVPAEAQQIGQQGPYVYVLKEGQVQNKPATLAEIRPIVPGQRQGDLIVVDKGVEAGEQVVTSGQMLVVPGGPVNVIKEPPPSQTAVSEAKQPSH
jgi:multidrug efflux system membrane fusion protein